VGPDVFIKKDGKFIGYLKNIIPNPLLIASFQLTGLETNATKFKIMKEPLTQKFGNADLPYYTINFNTPLLAMQLEPELIKIYPSGKIKDSSQKFKISFSKFDNKYYIFTPAKALQNLPNNNAISMSLIQNGNLTTLTDRHLFEIVPAPAPTKKSPTLENNKSYRIKLASDDTQVLTVNRQSFQRLVSTNASTDNDKLNSIVKVVDAGGGRIELVFVNGSRIKSPVSSILPSITSEETKLVVRKEGGDHYIIYGLQDGDWQALNLTTGTLQFSKVEIDKSTGSHTVDKNKHAQYQWYFEEVQPNEIPAQTPVKPTRGSPAKTHPDNKYRVYLAHNRTFFLAIKGDNEMVVTFTGLAPTATVPDLDAKSGTTSLAFDGKYLVAPNIDTSNKHIKLQNNPVQVVLRKEGGSDHYIIYVLHNGDFYALAVDDENNPSQLRFERVTKYNDVHTVDKNKHSRSLWYFEEVETKVAAVLSLRKVEFISDPRERAKLQGSYLSTTLKTANIPPNEIIALRDKIGGNNVTHDIVILNPYQYKAKYWNRVQKPATAADTTGLTEITGNQIDIKDMDYIQMVSKIDN